MPGTVAGLALAHERYGSGKFTLAQLIAPAIALAREGFAVEDDLADSLPRAQPRLARWPASAKIFLKGDGTPLRARRHAGAERSCVVAAGDRHAGPTRILQGPLAEKIVAGVKASGGIMTLDDLKNYRAIERPVVRGSYRGYEIASMPPPSSGGVHLIQILNILEGFPLRDLGAESAATLHLMIEAMKPAYADRAEFLGDPAFVKVPVAGLTSKRYAAELRKAIDPERARPAQSSARHAGRLRERQHHALFGGRRATATRSPTPTRSISATASAWSPKAPASCSTTSSTISPPRPARRTPMAWSAATPTRRAAASARSPRCRRRSCCATAASFLVTGTPGGSRIITMVLQVILNVIDHQMNIAEAVAAPRIHHQWLPDQVIAERGFRPTPSACSKRRGHKMVVGATFGSANSILVTPEGLTGAADPRQRGTLAEGY